MPTTLTLTEVREELFHATISFNDVQQAINNLNAANAGEAWLRSSLEQAKQSIGALCAELDTVYTGMTNPNDFKASIEVGDSYKTKLLSFGEDHVLQERLHALMDQSELLVKPESKEYSESAYHFDSFTGGTPEVTPLAFAERSNSDFGTTSCIVRLEEDFIQFSKGDVLEVDAHRICMLKSTHSAFRSIHNLTPDEVMTRMPEIPKVDLPLHGDSVKIRDGFAVKAQEADLKMITEISALPKSDWQKMADEKVKTSQSSIVLSGPSL